MKHLMSALGLFHKTSPTRTSQEEENRGVEGNARTRLPGWLDEIKALIIAGMYICAECALVKSYLALHGIDLNSVVLAGAAIPALRFVSPDQILGPAVEIIAAAGTAVIVRRLVRLGREAKTGQVRVGQELIDFIADFAESVFLANLLIALFRIPKVTLGSGINISLDDASIWVILTLAGVLGWNIRETRALFARMLRTVVAGRPESGDTRS